MINFEPINADNKLLPFFFLGIILENELYAMPQLTRTAIISASPNQELLMNKYRENADDSCMNYSRDFGRSTE